MICSFLEVIKKIIIINKYLLYTQGTKGVNCNILKEEPIKNY